MHTQPVGGLAEYFRNNVIGGAKSFVAFASDFEAFGEILAKKLVTEIAQSLGLNSVQPVAQELIVSSRGARGSASSRVPAPCS
jgi:hypothetical protein